MLKKKKKKQSERLPREELYAFVYEVAVRPQLQFIFFSKCFENSVSLFEIKRFCGTRTVGFLIDINKVLSSVKWWLIMSET